KLMFVLPITTSSADSAKWQKLVAVRGHWYSPASDPPQIGGASVGRWTTLPLIPQEQVLSIGTVRGLASAESIHAARLLVGEAVRELRTRGATKIVLRESDTVRQHMLQSIGFTHGNALVARNGGDYPQSSTPAGATIELWDEKGDTLAIENWRRMWLDNGVTDLREDYDEFTRSFIAAARREGRKFKTIVALNDGKPVGSLCCHLTSEDSGTIWAVYVLPEYRRQGIGTSLITHLKNYFFGDLGIARIDLLFASKAGCRLYKKAGWVEDDIFCLDMPTLDEFAENQVRVESPSLAIPIFDKSVISIAAAETGVEPFRIQSLLRTVPQQLEALSQFNPTIKALSSTIDRIQHENNLVDKTWFDRNRAKMGTGFDMKLLSEPDAMARKFDKLAKNWDNFIAGCRYNEIFRWLCKNVMESGLIENSASDLNDFCVLDLCCGVGYPGQTIRLMGYDGHMIGCDISRGMLNSAASRCCFDELFVTDANNGIPVPNGSVDVVVCTGAMELLEKWADVLKFCKNSLRANKMGELWVSFQERIEGGLNPTEHQNIVGLSQEEIEREFSHVGFEVITMVRCASAFVTPVDGGRLADIPYLFYRVSMKSR
ncbi:hypothetical protein HDU83_008295, partial [Entophlyctis luteolus]